MVPKGIAVVPKGIVVRKGRRGAKKGLRRTARQPGVVQPNIWGVWASEAGEGGRPKRAGLRNGKGGRIGVHQYTARYWGTARADIMSRCLFGVPCSVGDAMRRLTAAHRPVQWGGCNCPSHPHPLGQLHTLHSSGCSERDDCDGGVLPSADLPCAPLLFSPRESVHMWQ